MGDGRVMLSDRLMARGKGMKNKRKKKLRLKKQAESIAKAQRKFEEEQKAADFAEEWGAYQSETQRSGRY